jgi:hypothetical protein
MHLVGLKFLPPPLGCPQFAALAFGIDLVFLRRAGSGCHNSGRERLFFGSQFVSFLLTENVVVAKVWPCKPGKAYFNNNNN